MEKIFIPIEVYKNGKKKIWYIDLSEMSLSQLTELRKELLGTMSVGYFDRVFNDMMRNMTKKYTNIKQRKKDGKYSGMIMKKKTTNYRRGRR